MVKFAWLDLETTGLDETRRDAAILEVGIILTDEDLNEIARWSSPIFVPDGGVRCDAGVRSMHEASGLLNECRRALCMHGGVENQAFEFLDIYDATSLPMCGNTIGFDRRWLKRHMPKLHDAFHYRSLDVSSFKIAFGAWGYPLWTPPDVKANRSLADLECSLDELKHYRKLIKGEK